MPYDSAKPDHMFPNLPLQQAMSSSPGENRLQIAASMAPRPVVCTGRTSPVVPNRGRIISITAPNCSENSGVRWCMAGCAPASNT